MPIRRRTVRRRRPIRRRRYRYRPRRRVYRRPRYMRAVPNRMNTKLTYCDTVNTGIIANSNGIWTYQSSLFDPYLPLGGHQPLYFDQFAAMYYMYTVKGISYEVQAVGHSSNIETYPVGNLYLCVYASSSNTPFTTLSAAREYRFSKVSMIGSNIRTRMRGYYSLAKVFGLPRNVINADDKFSAKCNADPENKMYLFFQVFNITGSNINCELMIKLTYYSSFYYPIVIAQS